MNGIFYNMFRNGDLFVVREFARSTISQLPQFTWHYAHGNHPNSLKDMPCTYISMPHFFEVCESVGCKHHDIHELIPKYKPLDAGEPVRYLSTSSPLYINTWAGCWHGLKFPLGCYPNMHELLEIWRTIGQIVAQKTGSRLEFTDDVISYFPIVNYDVFDAELVLVAKKQFEHFDKTVLVANGRSMSGQSKLDVNVLNQVIIALAKMHPNIAFVLTGDIVVNAPNVFYTNRLFQKQYDLPEISYLSSFCNVIIGKNSGPFTYAHTKDNVLDERKIFVSFSNSARDNLLYDVKNAKCRFVHSDSVVQNEIAKILYDILHN